MFASGEMTTYNEITHRHTIKSPGLTVPCQNIQSASCAFVFPSRLPKRLSGSDHDRSLRGVALGSPLHDVIFTLLLAEAGVAA